MEGKLFLDTKLLRQHVTQIEQELRYTRILYDHIATARDRSGEELRGAYLKLLQDIQCLMDYFRVMAKVVDNIGDNAEYTVLRLGKLLQDMANSNPANSVFRGI